MREGENRATERKGEEGRERESRITWEIEGGAGRETAGAIIASRLTARHTEREVPSGRAGVFVPRGLSCWRMFVVAHTRHCLPMQHEARRARADERACGKQLTRRAKQ